MALLLAPLAEGQVLYGSLVGRVTDTSQAPVSGATVTIFHQSSNLARETTTNREGVYRFVNVQPGAHTVRVVPAGFREHVEEGVPVSANAVARVDVTLELGSVTESVTVQSERALLQTDTGDLHAELNAEDPPPPITRLELVHNWFAELERLCPTGGGS